MHETYLWFCDKHPEVHGLGVVLEDHQERSSEQMPHHEEWICCCQSQHALLYQARILTLPLFFYCLIPWIGLPCSHLKKIMTECSYIVQASYYLLPVIKVYWLQVHYQKIMVVLHCMNPVYFPEGMVFDEFENPVWSATCVAEYSNNYMYMLATACPNGKL